MPLIPEAHLSFLTPGRVYLWTLLTDDTIDAATACRFQEILTANEKNEAFRFRRVTAQQQFVIGRALVRLALSSHFDVPAGDWRFDRDCNHRPFITAPALSPPVSFSVSHTEGLVACLITLSAEAAVDVEKVKHNEDLDLVAREVLTPAEQKTLRALSGTEWITRFYDHWTLKEAYAKARGLGLSLTLSDIGFDLESDNTIGMHLAPEVDDDSSAWVFWHRHLSVQHTISVAVKKDFSNECEIILRPVKIDGARIALEACERGDTNID